MTFNQLQFPSKFHFHCKSNPQENHHSLWMLWEFPPAVPSTGLLQSRHDSSNCIIFCQLCAAIANSKLWNSISWASSCLPTMSTSGTPSSVSLGVLLFAVSFPVPDRPQTMRDLRGHGYTRTLQAAPFTSDRIRYSNNIPRMPEFHSSFVPI